MVKESKCITLTEDFLGRCMNCGKKFGGGIYDFYCCKECEEEDTKRIIVGIDAGKHPMSILHDTLEKFDE